MAEPLGAGPEHMELCMSFTTQPEIRGNLGVATSSHSLASAVGMSLLEEGGRAADAPVAMGFVLNVLEPHLDGPLGDLPVLVARRRCRGADGNLWPGCRACESDDRALQG